MGNYVVVQQQAHAYTCTPLDIFLLSIWKGWLFFSYNCILWSTFTFNITKRLIWSKFLIICLWNFQNFKRFKKATLFPSHSLVFFIFFKSFMREYRKKSSLVASTIKSQEIYFSKKLLTRGMLRWLLVDVTVPRIKTNTIYILYELNLIKVIVLIYCYMISSRHI